MLLIAITIFKLLILTTLLLSIIILIQLLKESQNIKLQQQIHLLIVSLCYSFS